MNRNQIRIIGGKHRGRKILFPNTDELRPTPDRVRVTLFNWLAPLLPDAQCLDLFSGSGVLGLEALSRGAHSVVFVEKNPMVAAAIEENVLKLGMTDGTKIIKANVLSWLESEGDPFDIVFLDPPYKIDVLPQCFSLLENHHWLNRGAKIYFESHNPINLIELPTAWKLLREKRAGHVYYYLAEKI